MKKKILSVAIVAIAIFLAVDFTFLKSVITFDEMLDENGLQYSDIEGVYMTKETEPDEDGIALEPHVTTESGIAQEACQELRRGNFKPVKELEKPRDNEITVYFKGDIYAEVLIDGRNIAVEWVKDNKTVSNTYYEADFDIDLDKLATELDK